MARDPARRYADARGELADGPRALPDRPARRGAPLHAGVSWCGAGCAAIGVAVGVAAIALVGARGSARRSACAGSSPRRRAPKRSATRLLEERGRTELLADRAGPALVYLVEAARQGGIAPARAFLLEEAMRPSQAEIATRTPAPAQVAIAVGADGRGVAAGADQLAAWRLDTGAALLDATPGRHIRALAMAGSRIAAGTDDGIAWVWSAARGPALALRGHRDAVLDIAFSADGRRIVTASRDHTARVWDAETGGAARDLDLPRGARRIGTVVP